MSEIPFNTLVARCRQVLLDAGAGAGPTLAVPIDDFRRLVEAVDSTDGPHTGVYRGKALADLVDDELIEAFQEVRRCAAISAGAYELDMQMLQAERARRIEVPAP